MRGFTLLESLVALVVLSLILTASYRIFGGGLLGVGREEQRVQMALIADGVMERIRLGEDLDRGATGTYRWSVSRTPFETSAGGVNRISDLTLGSRAGEEDELARSLDEIVITVSNRADDNFEMRTLVLVVEPE